MADPYATLGEAEDAVQRRIAEAMEARCNDPAQAEMRRRYLSGLDLPQGARAVEFGSGTGHVTRDLVAVAGAAEALGIEPSPVMIARARELFSDVPGLSFVQGDAAATGLPDESVDLVVMHTLLCHAPAAASILAEAARLLKPGGVAAVLDGDYELSSVSLSPFDPLQPVVDRMIQENVHDRWLPRRVAAMMKAAGLEPRRTEVFGYSAASDPAYFLTVIDRGADTLAADGVVSPEMAGAIKGEARRRVEADLFFASMNYVCVIAEKA